MLLDLTSLRQAVGALYPALEAASGEGNAEWLTSAQRETLRAGVVQTFKFTYELCWKFMARWLASNVSAEAVRGISRRELFRMAAEHRLIQNVPQWMQYHEARNLSVHTYNENIADRIVEVARIFVRDAETLLRELEACND